MNQPAHPYMANSAVGSKQALLDAVGIDDVEQLFAQIPADHRADAGVRIRAAQERDVRELGDVNVIGVPASAGGEPDGFGARHAAPDDGLAVGHVPRSGGNWATASIASTMA